MELRLPSGPRSKELRGSRLRVSDIVPFPEESASLEKNLGILPDAKEWIATVGCRPSDARVREHVHTCACGVCMCVCTCAFLCTPVFCCHTHRYAQAPQSPAEGRGTLYFHGLPQRLSLKTFPSPSFLQNEKPNCISKQLKNRFLCK